MKTKLLPILLLFPFCAVFAQGIVPQGHRGRVNEIVEDSAGRLLTIGEDGFV